MTDPNETMNQDNSGDINPDQLMANDLLKKKIVDWTKSQFNKMKADRVQIERQWYLNLAFYFGNQNVVPSNNTVNTYSGPGTGTLTTPKAPYYRSRPVINRIRPTIRREQAKLTAQKPSAFIIPASSEDRDLYAAQAGEQIWESIYNDKKLESVLSRSVFWTLTCGTGFIKSYWDPSLVDRNNDQQGDFCFEVETPFHVYVPNLREEDLERQPYLIHAMKKSRDFAKLMFPGVDPKPGSGDQGDTSISENQYLNLNATNATREQNDILILEVWIKPGAVPQFPDGAMYTIVGDTIVQGTNGWPYEHSMYPFAKIDHIASGKFYGESSIVDLIPLQREYNRTRGQIIEAKNRMAKPQLLAERGSVDPSRITSEPGQVILYNSGFQPPQPLPLQSIPPYVIQELERILTDWSDISGTHEVSQGQVPPGVTAATAISYLQEQDETMLARTVKSIEAAMEKTAHLALEYVHQFWDSTRALKIIGKDGSFDYLAFQGSDLRGNTDIQIEGGSALPTSKAAKQAFIMDMMKMGFIDPNEGLAMMDMGGVNRITERLQVDKKQAQRENLKMSQVTQDLLNQHFQESTQKALQQGAAMGPDGLPADPITGEILPPDLVIPVNTWDNHVVHIEEHNNYRKGQTYDSLDDVQKALFEQHVQQHLDSVAAMQQGMMPPDMGGGSSLDNPDASTQSAGGTGPQPDQGPSSTNTSEVPMNAPPSGGG